MKKYIIVIGLNEYESTSRDAKKHLRDHGGEKCTVWCNDKKVSEARRAENKIYSCTV